MSDYMTEDGPTEDDDHCENPATVQFVYADINTGLNKISKPHCDECSEASQPAETTDMLPIFGRHECAGEVWYP